jgi:hypothetical protein
MNKSTILTFAFFALSTMVVAQTTPIDFEEGGNGADWTWEVFENGSNPAVEVIDNPDASGNTSAKVAKITVVPEGQPWAGTISKDITPFKFDSSNSIVKIWVWKSIISDVGLKFETASAASNGEIKVANTVTNAWEELTFDFSSQPNFGDDFTGLVVFPDFVARTDTNVIFFDQITFGDGTTTGPEPVTVTFNVNTSTLQDTLYETGSVQMRGGLVGSDAAGTGLGSTVTWDSGTLAATNIGGDYWNLKFDMSPGDTLNYKWWAGYDPDNGLINGNETGWESGANNQFILPSDASSDTTVALQWFEDRTSPFPTNADSVVVSFRVNVGAQVQTGVLDPNVDKVGIRGTPNFFDNPDDWSSSAFYLENIGGSGDNVFYGGYTMIHKDNAATIGTAEYKFVIENSDGTTWEDGNNTVFTVPISDSTTYWKFFSGVAPTKDEIVDTKLNFEVNVGILEGIGFFNSAIDTVFVRGTFNGWSTDNQMSFDDLSGKYVASNLDRTAAVGAQEKYKYYIKWDTRRDSAESDFYLAGITHDGSGWEEPGITGGADRVMVIENATSQPVRSESFNGVVPQALMTPGNVEGGEITVTFNVDMTPATTRDDGTSPFSVSKDSVFLFVDTPFFALTNDIIVPGDGGNEFINQTDEQREKIRFTDDDGDMIYTLDLSLMLPTLNHIGFRIAYGEPTAENGEIIINGGGFDAGRRHYQYVQPLVAVDGDDLDDLPDVSWPSSFTMPTIIWQKDDLPWETPPDYTTINVSSELDSDKAKKFVLAQNYPNPFNPSTNISFSMPNAANVSLKVYNVLGQEVASLINNKAMTAGTHSVAFDASALSSGMYIYRIEAGSYVSTKRMMLIK